MMSIIYWISKNEYTVQYVKLKGLKFVYYRYIFPNKATSTFIINTGNRSKTKALKTSNTQMLYCQKGFTNNAIIKFLLQDCMKLTILY